MGDEEEVIKQNSVPSKVPVYDNEAILAKATSSIAAFTQLLEEVTIIEKVIDKLVTSEIVKANFSKFVTVGNKEVAEVDRGDVMICIQMAMHLGIPPMVALTMGKVFNKVGYLKAVTGVALGFDPMVSQTKFFGFEDKDKNLQAGMYVSTMQILAANKGITFDYLEDDIPVRWYKSSNNEFMGTVLEANMVVVPSADVTKDWSDAQRTDFQSKLSTPGIIGCTIGGVTRRTTVMGSRTYPNGEKQTVTRSYCLQEAIDAGLAKGKTTWGDPVTGKQNWVNVKDMLSVRTIGRVVKIIGSDAFNGIPLVDELKDSSNLIAIG